MLRRVSTIFSGQPVPNGPSKSDDTEEVAETNTKSRLVLTAEGNLDASLLKRTEGFMYKKGGAVNARGGRRNWKLRYFSLNEVAMSWGTGYELRYYERKGGDWKGTVNLEKIEVFCDESSRKDGHKVVKFDFQLMLANGNLLELSCDTAEERNEWIDTFNMVIAYNRKMLSTAGSTINLDGYDPLFEDDPEVYQIGSAIALNTQAFGSGLYGAEAGQHGQFVIQINDSVGQRVPRGGMPLTVTISNDEVLYYLKVQDNDDGSYFVHYRLNKPGKFNLNIRINDEHDIFGSPFEMEIFPAKTVAENCVAEGECLAHIYTGVDSKFKIFAKDVFGNNKIRGGDPFELGVMGPAQLKSLQDNADGSYTCTLEAQTSNDEAYFTSATLLIMVTLHGKHIKGSPFNATIVDDKPLISASSSVAAAIEVPPPPPSGSNRHKQTPSISEPSLKNSQELPPPPPPVQPPPSSSQSTVVESVGLAVNMSPPSAPEVPVTSYSEPRSVPLTPPPPLPTYTEEQFNALSRLEKARYKALQAQMQIYLEQSSKNQAIGNAVGSASANAMSPPIPPPPAASGNRFAQLQKFSNQFKSSDASVSTTASSAPPSEANAGKFQAVLRQQASASKIASSPAATNEVYSLSVTEFLQNPQMKFHALISETCDLLSRAEQERLWNICGRYLQQSNAIEILSTNAKNLRLAFDIISEAGKDNASVVLLQSAREKFGVYKLFEEFDIIPNYLSRKEVKVLFHLVCNSMQNSEEKAIPSLTYLGFIYFVYISAIFALSKNSAFNSLYNSPEDKLRVLLSKCGLADAKKIAIVKGEFSQPESKPGVGGRAALGKNTRK